MLQARFRTKLVSDRNECSLELVRLLDMGHVSQMLEPDQLLGGSLQRGIELLNQNKGHSIVISSGEEAHGNGELGDVLQQIHPHDFVAHLPAGKLHVRPRRTLHNVGNGAFGCIEQDGEDCSRIQRMHHTAVMGKPPALDKRTVSPIRIRAAQLLKYANGLVIVLRLSMLQHILVGQVLAVLHVDDLMLVFAPVIGVSLSVGLVITLMLEMLLVAFTMTSLGIVIASRLQQMQSFSIVVQFILMPMFFVSGALFPLTNVPGWLSFLNKIDPVTYGVDPLRQAVLNSLNLPPQVSSQLGLGVTIFGTTLSVWAELLIVAVLGAIFVTWAAIAFAVQD